MQEGEKRDAQPSCRVRKAENEGIFGIIPAALATQDPMRTVLCDEIDG